MKNSTFIVRLSMLLFGLVFSVNTFSQTTINIPITSGAADSGDDAEQRLSDGSMSLTSSDLEFCYDFDDDPNGEQLVGIRFQGVTIPMGATINNAYIQFDADEVRTGAVTINIAGIDIDDAVQFTSTDYDISDRIDGTISSSTTANVNWSPSNWTTIGANTANERTSDISTIVKEIVDRNGWSSGNDMAFVFSPVSGEPNRRTAEDGDSATHKLELHVTYTIPSGAEINIQANSTNIIDGQTTISSTDNTDYGIVTEPGGSLAKTFTVQNFGASSLSVSNPVITGDTGDFIVTANPSSSVAAGGSTSFTITFDPTTTGTRSATVSVTNGDSDENPYTFNIEGVGETPTIDNFGFGGSWKYLDTGVDQGTAWRASAFDDSSWATGNAELGFGDGDETTTLTDVGQATTYFRKSFNVTASEASFSDLILDLLYDDGAVVYLNGTEIWRVNMPGGAIAYGTYASTDPGDNATDTTTLTNTLITGTNVIAVEIHQRNSSSTDISFDMDLRVENNIISAGGTWKYLDDGSNQGTSWTGTGFDDSSWASGAAELGYGDTQTTTVSYGGDSSNKYPTTYFRKTFTVTSTEAAMNKIHLSAILDDGAVVYINGTKVWMFNMPVTYDYLSYAEITIDGASESRWWTYELENLLVTGSNTIAVEVHNRSAGSSDISFNLQMSLSNDNIYTPIFLDNDTDTALDWNDGDDDNDGVPDIVEGCVTADMEDLNTTGSEDVLTSFPYTTTLSDGNVITYSVSDINDFNAGTGITSYQAGNHGWGLRVSGADTDGLLTISFANDIDNLFFRLVDFDENEQWTVNVYDDTNTLIDLTTRGVAHLGYHVEQTGNSFRDRTTADGDNVNGDNYLWDIYGAMYLYFPNDSVSRIELSTVQNIGSTIRIVGIQYCDQDTDNDGIEDYKDSDSDNDSIPDIVEAGGVDTVGNGLIDSSTDTDNDGILNTYDANPSSFLVEDPSTIIDYDFDGDGIPNRIDLDSDNDGILDIIEVSEADSNGDGQIDGFTDSNNDGYHDSYDGGSSRLITGSDGGSGIPSSYPNKNTDGTGLPNYSDIDSDDDGITDNTEAQATGLHISYTATQTDTDGVADVYDNSGTWGANGLTPIDTDFDCIPDYLDTNSDDDLEDDVIEGHDTNGDGVVNGSDSPNADTGLFTGTDTDGDGLDDGFDNTDGAFNSTNTSLQATSHPISDALYNRDWRASNSPIDFDGTNDFIDFGDNHDITGSFSLEAWVLQQATSGSEATIMSKADGKSGNRRGYQLTIDSSNRPNLSWFNSSGIAVLNITSAYSITNNKWYHISATYNGSDAYLYIDGVQVATGSTGTAPLDGAEKFMIGAMYDSDDACSGATKYFNGYIDEVRLWSVALSSTQLREMMNQEINNPSGSIVRGSTIPKNITSVVWEGLEGYYPMNTGIAVDQSGNTNNGFPKNINTTQLQTAPLPYTTKANGDWNDATGATPWTYGDTVWNTPNGTGVDGSTSIDWNIVETNHDVTIDTYASLGKERTVLGLKVLSNELLVDGNNAAGTGNGLTVTSYLELNGEIDLEGESQLIQTTNSDLVVGGSGKLFRDQQGTADTYTYNYWSSPVGVTDLETNEYSYTLPGVMKDGTTNINFITSGYDGTNTSPIGLADYWIWKFANQADDDYASWQHIRSTGTIEAGEGYTMKGPGTGSIITDQNYVFSGKPNNGNIALSLGAGNDYLVGNPYASAIDAYEFINDNSSAITGTLYFWEHFGGGNHILADYQGGYHMLNLSGSTTVATYTTNDPDVNAGGTPISPPGNYIPVSQGFFVVADADGGTINFNNSQRIFHKESSGNSTFVENEEANATIDFGTLNNESTTNTINSVDNRLKLRVGFNSINTIRRQLLATVDPNATENIDWGYDGMHNETQMDDMFWLIEDERFAIQGINTIDEETILPLGIYTDSEGLNKIILDDLENAPENLTVYVHDKVLDIYHNLNNSDYEVYLTPGTYLERFEITFINPDALSIEENELNTLDVHYSNIKESIVLINPNLQTIKSIEIVNILGQKTHAFNNISNENYKEIEVKNLSPGAYIIKLNTANGTVTKKVLVE